MECRVKDIVKYLGKYNNPCPDEYAEASDENLSVILKLYDYLNTMPTCTAEEMYRLKGAYRAKEYAYANYELFYICTMVKLRQLLDDNRYASFIHEAYDFFRYNVGKNEVNNSLVLPKNIKDAFILVIKSSIVKDTDY